MIPLQTPSSHPVSHIIFSPDGATVAVAQPHYGVTLLERASGRTIAVCAMPRRAQLSGLTFCGAGKYLAAAHAKGLEVFDANTGARVFANFHYPQGKVFLATRGDVLLGAAPTNYTALRPLLKANEAVASPEVTKSLLYRRDLTPVACAPDGSHVLSADRNRFVLLNVDADRTVVEIERSDVNRPVAGFCPLGHRFAINDGHTLDVYDTVESAEDEQPNDTPLVQRANDTQTAVAPMPHTVLAPTFTLKPDKLAEVGTWYPPFALAADGRGLLVKRPRNRIQLWDAPTGTLVNEWSWRFEWVTCVVVSADGLTAVAGGRFGRVILWDLE